MIIATKDPITPSEIIFSTKDIDPIILKCLSKESSDKFNSVDELLKAIDDYNI